MLSLNICVSAPGGEQKIDEGTTRVVHSRKKSTPKPKDGARLYFHSTSLLNKLPFSSKCKEFDLWPSMLDSFAWLHFLHPVKQQHVGLPTPESPHFAALQLLLLIVACECYYFSIDYLFFGLPPCRPSFLILPNLNQNSKKCCVSSNSLLVFYFLFFGRDL